MLKVSAAVTGKKIVHIVNFKLLSIFVGTCDVKFSKIHSSVNFCVASCVRRGSADRFLDRHWDRLRPFKLTGKQEGHISGRSDV